MRRPSRPSRAFKPKVAKAVAVQADMSQVTDARRLVIETVKQFGRLDILVNNAGRFLSKPLLEATEADFDQIITLNAKGPYFTMQEAANVLKEGGRIVKISTDGTHLSFPGAPAYLAARAHWNSTRKGWRRNSLHEALPSTRSRQVLPRLA